MRKSISASPRNTGSASSVGGDNGPSLPRELVRWLQTLDLPVQIRHPKRDLSNGYLAAEICARYWSSVDLRQFDNGTSTKVKEANWKALRLMMAKNNATLPDTLVADVIQCRNDGGRVLLEALYSMFTNRVVHKVAPPAVAEVAVPTYVRAQQPSAADVQQQQRLQQQQLQQQQQHAAEQQQADQLSREDQERQAAAAEAERRRIEKLHAVTAAAARKVRQPLKVQAISAAPADDQETLAEANKLQFSGVTVKPLTGQALARLGIASARQEAAAASNANAPSNDGGKGASTLPRLAVGDGVLSQLSAVIEAGLKQQSGNPAWAVPPGVTSIEYFAQHHTRLPPAVKDVVWQALYAEMDATTAWLLARPTDLPTFAALFAPGVSTLAVQLLIGRPHFAFTGLDGANAAVLCKRVFSSISQKRLSFATTTLSRHVLPLVGPSFVRGTPFVDLVACLDTLSALAGCALPDEDASSPTPPPAAVVELLEGRIRQLLTVLHRGFLGTEAVSGPAVPGTRVERYTAFLAAADAVCELRCSTAAAAQTPSQIEEALDPDGAAAQTSGPRGEGTPLHEMHVAVSESIDGKQQPGKPSKCLHAGVAAAVHYHANAALHHSSATVRVHGARLLSRLAQFGCVGYVLPLHATLLTSALGRPVDHGGAKGYHDDWVAQLIHLAGHCLKALAEPTADQALVAQFQHSLQDIAMSVLSSNGGVFEQLTRADQLVALCELVNVAAPNAKVGGDDDGRSQAAVNVAVRAVVEMPPPLRLYLTRVDSDARPPVAALQSTFGVPDPTRRAARHVQLHGTPDSWPTIPVLHALASTLAARPIIPPTLPSKATGSVGASRRAPPALPPGDTADAEALSQAAAIVDLVYQFTVRKKGPLCTKADIPEGWTVLRALWPELHKGVKYLEHLGTLLRVRRVTLPEGSLAHTAMIPIARRCVAIVFRLFAEWSGVPSAEESAAGALAALVTNIDAPAPSAFEGVGSEPDPLVIVGALAGADRVLEWWSTVAKPDNLAATMTNPTPTPTL